jgi:Tol biopolymer transport system component
VRVGLQRALFGSGAAVTALALIPVLAPAARTAARDDTPVEIGAPVWSPTRAELALTASFDEHALCGVDSGRDPDAPPKRDVFIVNANGSDLRRLGPSAPHDAREGPAWAPNGARLSATLWTSSTRVDSNVQIVTRTGHVDYAEIFAGPAGWAPDSRHVAINRFDPTDSPTDTVIRDLSTGSVWRLGPYGFGVVHWSPHGNLIAYASNGFVYTVRTNRTGRHRVMPAADVFALQWSGDGTLLGYQGSSRLGYGPVFVVAPDGRHRRRLTRGDTSWSWSPRGRVLALNRELIDFATRRRCAPCRGRSLACGRSCGHRMDGRSHT